jgi:hypothetical protein
MTSDGNPMTLTTITEALAYCPDPYLLQWFTVTNGRGVRSFDRYLLSGLTTNQAVIYDLSSVKLAWLESRK